MSKRRILIVDDHLMFADALARVLRDDPDFEVVGVVESAEAALAHSGAIDLALVDVQLGSADGVELALLLRQRSIHVVLLTGGGGGAAGSRALEAGLAMVHKTNGTRALLSAIRMVTEGSAPVLPALSGRRDPVAVNDVAVNDAATGDAALVPSRAEQVVVTDRERQVLLLLAGGASSKEVASSMGITLNTARNYVQHLLEKLGARNRLDAVRLAREAGLLG